MSGSAVSLFAAAIRQPVVLPKWAIGSGIAVILLLLSSIALTPSYAPAGRLRGAEPAIPTRQELGRATWTFLHRMAAQYDSEPDESTQASMSAFINSLGQFYPCSTCAEHFRGMLAVTPPDVSSNVALAQWMCARHNEVNARLGKAAFSCEISALEARWGDCGCGDAPQPPPFPLPEH